MSDMNNTSNLPSNITTNQNPTFDPAAASNISTCPITPDVPSTPGGGDNYTVLVHHVLPHSEPGKVSASSPDHRFVCTISGDGGVTIVDRKTGHLAGVLSFSIVRLPTCLVWTSPRQVVFGTGTGDVVQASLNLSPSKDQTIIASVSPIGYRHDNSILAVACDLGRGLLVAAFEGGFSLYHRSVDSTDERQWEPTAWFPFRHHFNTSTIQILGTHVFIGASDGFLSWSYENRAGLWTPMPDFLIKHSAVSFNRSYLAVTTDRFEVLISPVLGSGVLSTASHSIYVIPTGREWASVVEAPPVAFLGNSTIVSADPLGSLYFIDVHGNYLGSYNCGPGYHIRSIITHSQGIIVLALTPGGTTTLLNLPKDCFIKRGAIATSIVDLGKVSTYIFQDVSRIPVGPLKTRLPDIAAVIQSQTPRIEPKDSDWSLHSTPPNPIPGSQSLLPPDLPQFDWEAIVGCLLFAATYVYGEFMFAIMVSAGDVVMQGLFNLIFMILYMIAFTLQT